MPACWMCGCATTKGDICCACEGNRKPSKRGTPASKPIKGPTSKNTRYPTWRRKIAAKLAAQQGNLCALCNHPFTATRPPTLDHVVPKRLGGVNAQTNLQAAHEKCNSVRGSLTMREFRERLADGRLTLPEPPTDER